MLSEGWAALLPEAASLRVNHVWEVAWPQRSGCPGSAVLALQRGFFLQDAVDGWQVKDTEREGEKRKSYLEKLNDNMPYPDELRDWHQEWVIMGHQVRMLSEEQRVPCGQTRWWKGGWESVSETLRGGEWRLPHTEPWWGQVPSGRGIAMALIQEWLWGTLPTHRGRSTCQTPLAPLPTHRERSTCQTPLAQLECTMAAQPF